MPFQGCAEMGMILPWSWELVYKCNVQMKEELSPETLESMYEAFILVEYK